MSAVSLRALDLTDLRRELTGSAELPGAAGYEAARQAWNLTVDQRPALVARAHSTADVVAVVRFAAEHGLRVAPQSAGHGAARLGPLEQSVLLRTDAMRGVQIDAARRTARVEAGALWSDLAAASSPLQLSGLGGSVPNVGVVAFALGGGLGWLARGHGLCCHRLTAIELVTPQCGWIRCDSAHHAELFWSLRGGGGDLGVVTAAELELVAVPELFGGTMLWPAERAAEVLPAWRRWTETVPETVTTAARLLRVPPIPEAPEPLRGRAFVTVGGAITGSVDAATELLAPLRALDPELDLFAPQTAEGLLRLHLEPEQPVSALSTHTLLHDLTPNTIDALLTAAGPDSDSRLLSLELRHLGGAVATEQFGALPCLEAPYVLFAVGMPTPATPSRLIDAQLAGVRAAVSEWACALEYLNFGDSPGQSQRSLLPDTQDAIARCRARTDPDGVIQRV